MKIEDKEALLKTLKCLLEKKEETDLEDAISLNDLVRLTEVAYAVRKKEVKELIKKMEEKLNSKSVNLQFKNQELFVNIHTNIRTENQFFYLIGGKLFEKDKKDQLNNYLMKLIGRELNSYYFDIATNDMYIDEFYISIPDCEIKFVLDDNFISECSIFVTVGDDNVYCSINKSLNEKDYRITCDSCSLSKFINENLEDLFDNIRIPKDVCPEIIVKMYEDELIQKDKKVKEFVNKKERPLNKILFRKNNKSQD